MFDVFIRNLKALVAELHEIVELTPSAVEKINEINLVIDNYTQEWKPAEQDIKGLSQWPVPVQIKKEFFEEDWLEAGMRINLMGCEWLEEDQCYKISYSAEGFDEHNARLMSEVYYPTDRTKALVREGKLEEKEFYTAVEAGQYTQYAYSFLNPRVDGDWSHERNDAAMAQTLLDDYIVIIERI